MMGFLVFRHCTIQNMLSFSPVHYKDLDQFRIVSELDDAQGGLVNKLNVYRNNCLGTWYCPLYLLIFYADCKNKTDYKKHFE